MSDDPKRIELTRMVLGKDWAPRVQYPATFHNRRRANDVGGNRGGETRDAHPNQNKPRKNLLNSLMGGLHRLRRGRSNEPLTGNPSTGQIHMQDDPKDIDIRLRSVRENDDGTIVISQARWNRGRGIAKPHPSTLARHGHHWHTDHAPTPPHEHFLYRMLKKLGLR